MKQSILLLLALSLIGCGAAPKTNAPVIQTSGPIIHLADNLDEKDKLGWCIDTEGRGFSETLHAHSCKPEGDDVLFRYDSETLQICSVAYPGFCAAMVGGPRQGMTLGLVKSDPTSPDQKFTYDKESGEFRPQEDSTLCLAVGGESEAAGPYMSRVLTLKPHASTERSLKEWVIKE